MRNLYDKNDFSGLYCKYMMIANDDSRILNKLGASLSDDPRD